MLKEKILILTAMQEERLKKVPKGITHEVIGMGQVNASINSMYAIKKYRPHLVILIGLCGAINRRLKQGDIVIGQTFINGDYDLTELEYNFQQETIHTRPWKYLKENTQLNKKEFYFGTYHCTSKFATTGQKKQLKGDVVDMESFAVASACKKLGKKLLVIKTVSEEAEGNTKEEFSKFLKEVYNPDELLKDIMRCLR